MRCERLTTVEVAVEELERADAMDGVRTVEVLDLRAVAAAKQVIAAARFGEFIGDPFVGSDAVGVAALHHEGAREDQSAYLRIVEGVAQVELHHIVLRKEQIAIGTTHRSVLPDPLIVVRRADGKAVAIEEGGHAHGSLAAVADAVEAD